MTGGQKNMVWIHVDTNHQVGHPDHLKVFANPEAADEWFQKKRSRRRCVRIRGRRVIDLARPTQGLLRSLAF
jgi:hypothetical protein